MSDDKTVRTPRDPGYVDSLVTMQKNREWKGMRESIRRIPGSSRYVKFLPFGMYFGGFFGTNFTHLEDPGI